MDNHLELTFYGGVGTTTGANIMLDFRGNKILVDCGLLQGLKEAERKNFDSFEYNPSEVEFLLITHAHMDHIGRVPKLVRDGFKGRIISTVETKELSLSSLQDALKVIKSHFPNEILFEKEDIEETFSRWDTIDYYKEKDIFKGCKIKFLNAGHILGSAIIEVSCDMGGVTKKIAFTGDLGNSPSPLLPDADFVENTDYIVMESVYGDRNHESKIERREKLKIAITGGIEKEGTIIIPAFSIERTQVLLYEINKMIEGGEIQKVPVYLDSPLASKVTYIYQKYKKDFKDSVRQEINSGDDIFDFPGLEIIQSLEDSLKIEKTVGPKIIIAGSGMSEGGKVVNHELNHLGDERATIILVGYQSVGSLGRKIEEGMKEVFIYRNHKKQKVKIRAKVEVIKGYSSHKDSEHLLEFVERANNSSRAKNRLKKVFVIMGEPKSSIFLTQRIRDYIGADAIYPETGKVYNL